MMDLEDLAIIEKMVSPGFSKEYLFLAACVAKFTHHKVEDEFLKTVQTRTVLSWETFEALLLLTAKGYYTSAFGLSRNLFESVIGTLYLLKHPEEVREFLDHGKVMCYEILRDQGAPERFLQRNRAEYERLAPKFRKKGKNDVGFWFKRSIARLLKDELGLNAYPYYREASSVAHGDAYIGMSYTNGAWIFSAKSGQELAQIDLGIWIGYYLTALSMLRVARYVPEIAENALILKSIMEESVNRINAPTGGRPVYAQ
jgi:hypothetical protein